VEKNKKQLPRFNIWYFLIIFILFIFLQRLFLPSKSTTEISYSAFKDSLRSNKIERVTLSENKISGKFRTPLDEQQPDAKEDERNWYTVPWSTKTVDASRLFQTVRVEDENLVDQLEEHDVEYEGKVNSNWFMQTIGWILPFLILIFIWVYIFRRMSKGMQGGAGGGQNIFNIGKSKAKMYIEDKNNKISFEDVAGVDEAKHELTEMIDFLKNPEKFTRLGAKLPKGVILIGPPGTGKTLLARAVAGEAKVPFFNLTGSEFVEMFVGVGAARVRDLFKEAKTKAPCIVFIDEIDAIGKSRGQAMQMGANDERENTLNQLLAEMDGFAPGDAIILMASTNRPEVLDRALLRPGRFDRQVLVDRPDLKGRLDILKVHTRKLAIAKEADLQNVAEQTPGFSGADLANICNEAALLASRRDKNHIELIDFQEAIERVIAGLEKKNRLINKKERKIVAFHESGHAIVGHFTPGADPVRKVSIVPRGIGALGFTMQTPVEDRFLMSKNELIGKIKGLLGGRAAEKVVFGDISTGAANDLERVTKIAYDMVTIYGMSEKIPNISLKKQNQNQLLTQDFMTERRSDNIEHVIDDEAIAIIENAFTETVGLINEKQEQLHTMANRLLEKEVLMENDVNDILGERPDNSE
jgi:cell division protease FtsH